jgi:hypothetical protein
MDPKEWSEETVYDVFEVDDFFVRSLPFEIPNSGDTVSMANPRNLYKKLLIDSGKLLPMILFDQVNDVRAEFEAAKNLFQKNWRLHSASWSDYEKKKVTGSTGSLKKL